MNTDDTSWMALADCKSHSVQMFHPTQPEIVAHRNRGRTLPGILVCSTCPVTDICFEYALRNMIDDGIWGGTLGDERRRVRKARARAQTSPIPALRPAIPGEDRSA